VLLNTVEIVVVVGGGGGVVGAIVLMYLGGDTVISVDRNDGITLKGVALSSLQASNFIFVAPTVTISPIEGNNLINFAEARAPEGVPIAGAATGFAANSTFQLTLTDGVFSKSYRATVDGTGTGWTATIPASDATSLVDGTATLTAQVTDAFGNASTLAVQTVAVHETLPTVTINAIDNGLINAAAAASGVPLSGTVTGIAANSTFLVSLTDGAFSNSYTATVNGAGTGWTAMIPAGDATALADGTATVTAKVTDQYGNVSLPAVQTVPVHETLPTVTIDAIDNGLINAAAGAAGVSLSGSVSGLAANSTFLLTLSDGAFSKSYTSTVNAAGTGWTATILAGDATGPADGTATVTAQVSDQYGNVSLPAVQTVAVHETLPTVTINAIDNGLINAAAAGVSLSGSVSGLAANSTFLLTLSDGAFSNHYTATVNGASTGWTTTIPAGDATALADGTATVTAQVTDQYGNDSTLVVQTVAVHETLPTVTINAIDGNDTLNASEAQSVLTIGGSSTEAIDQTVTVALNGVKYAGQVASDGSWSVPVPAVPAPTNNASIFRSFSRS
jgi:hypothetical protein